MGYLFLINVIIILAQASGVVDIFYDVLGKLVERSLLYCFVAHDMYLSYQTKYTPHSHDFGQP